MRNVYLAVTLEYIINTVNIKQVDSRNYWLMKDYLCKYLTSFLERSETSQSLRFYVFEGQPFLR